MKRLIIFLISRRLGLKFGEQFRFTNQKSDDIYWFSPLGYLLKANPKYPVPLESGVSINWLLSDKCEVKRLKKNRR